MAQHGATDAVDEARAAASRGDWQDAFRRFMQLDGGGALEAGDVPLLAQVAYAAGHLDVAIAAWERVHRRCVDDGDEVGAGGAAARVAMHLLFDTALMAPVRGWLRRAESHLEGQDDSAAHAWHAVVRTYERLLSGDPDSARSWAQRAVHLGTDHDPAAAAIGQVAVARLMLLDGEVDAGLALLEDVGVTTTGGHLDPLSTGVVFCELVCALQGAAQLDLAEEWTEAMERWCATNAIGSLHGRCRVHRAEILRLRGRCAEAEVEASRACDELRLYLRRELGWPLTELGLIRLRLGDHSGAAEALLAADQLGWDPQPGLARLHLAQGNLAAAADGIRGALERPRIVPSKERPPNNDLDRAPLLAAQVEIELAGGEVERAAAAADELDAIADRFKSRALEGEAELARGRVLRAEGHTAEALRHLASATEIWRDVRAPYELAIAHAELAEAHRLAGQDRQAELEDETSRAILQSIQRRADGPPPDESTVGGDDAESCLIREGDYWTVAFAGTTTRVRDLRGIHHLARLLSAPGREFHVLDLITADDPGRSSTGSSRHEGELGNVGDAGDLLDAQARTAYRRRLAEIDDDIDDARSAGDLHRAAQAEVERDFLVQELSRAFGIGGRSRKAGAASERARVAATRALRAALHRIAEHHEVLGQHLDHTIRTGTYCSYQPDPRDTVHWQL